MNEFHIQCSFQTVVGMATDQYTLWAIISLFLKFADLVCSPVMTLRNTL